MDGPYVGSRTRKRGRRRTAEYESRPWSCDGGDMGEYRVIRVAERSKGNGNREHTTRSERSERRGGCIDLMKITKVETYGK